jgi:hypothetical protein
MNDESGDQLSVLIGLNNNPINKILVCALCVLICLNLTLDAGIRADRQGELPGSHPAFLRLPFSCLSSSSYLTGPFITFLEIKTPRGLLNPLGIRSGLIT